MREQKGITLIALVITIIVLLILAGVTIAMLTGENGILNRSSESKYDNILASIDENAKLAQLGVKTSITAEMVNSGGYIATNTPTGIYKAGNDDTKFGALVNQVAKDLGTSATSVQTEGYTVWGYIDNQGKTDTNGTGYIYITYSDNSLRSSLPGDSVKDASFTTSGITYNTSLVSDSTVNQAAVVYVIKVTNYDCELCPTPWIVTDTNVKADFGLIKFGDATSVKAMKNDFKLE